jgi:hypothetical protein
MCCVDCSELPAVSADAPLEEPGPSALGLGGLVSSLEESIRDAGTLLRAASARGTRSAHAVELVREMLAEVRCWFGFLISSFSVQGYKGTFS